MWREGRDSREESIRHSRRISGKVWKQAGTSFFPHVINQKNQSIDANQFISWQCDQQANDIIGCRRDGAVDASVADSIEKGFRPCVSRTGKSEGGKSGVRVVDDFGRIEIHTQ